MTVDELHDENERLKAVITEALGYVQGWDRHKPFENPDLMGEMVSIRLTGLCLLAEIVRPGCREIADALFLTGWVHPIDEEQAALKAARNK